MLLEQSRFAGFDGTIDTILHFRGLVASSVRNCAHLNLEALCPSLVVEALCPPTEGNLPFIQISVKILAKEGL